MAKCREITLLSLMRGGDEELAQLRDIFVFVAGVGNFWFAACWFALNPDPRFASNIDPPFEPVFGVR